MLVPLFASKGRALHRRAGWVFAAAMTLATVTGIASSIGWIAIPQLVKQLPSDPRRAAHAIGQLRAGGAFFGVLSLMSAQALVFGLVATRFPDQRPMQHPLASTVTALLAVASGVALFVALHTHSVLAGVFAVLGLLNAINPLRRKKAKSWLRTHIEARLGACTVATTPFTVQMVGRGSASMLTMALAWSAPIAVGMATTAWWTRRIDKRKIALHRA